MDSEVTEYKLSWEMPDPHWAAAICGDSDSYDFAPLWDNIPWREKPTEKVTLNFEEIRSQHKQLRYWEDTKLQPIRNVTLVSRTYVPTEWEPYTPD